MRFSIRDKLLLSYTLLVGISFLLMIFFINKTIIKNNENIVLEDLSKIDKNVKVYTQQYFILNNVNDSKSAFIKIHEDFLEDLNQRLVERGELYFDDGKIARDTSYRKKGEDLKLTIDNKSTSIIYFNGQTVTATFSIPIIYKNNLMGVYRFSKDYSKLYQSGYFLIKSISIFAIITGFGIVVISLTISYSMLKPLSKLRDYSISMADGNFDVEVDIKSKDEIGELAQQFIKMKNQIHSQIQAISSAHENLTRIENYRKQFFDNVTHELKTPLTIISGFAQMIEDTNYSDRELLKRGIRYIQDESQRLHRLVLKLLDVSHQNSDSINDTFKTFCISDLIEAVCEEIKIKASGHGIVIHRDIEPNIYVNGSHDDLRSVFINLIDNAIKYSLESTSIEVTAQLEDSQVKIAVRDYGIGIPENLLDKVFEPFFREKLNSNTTEGTGLGLFIAKQIVENHNGLIYITSTEHQGTCVHLQIPAES
jgi:signal transduction histidine kinase